MSRPTPHSPTRSPREWSPLLFHRSHCRRLALLEEVEERDPSDKPRDNILAVPITDTSSSAQAVQLQVQRSMSGEQRLLLAFEMSMFARVLSGERIRREHPGWTESQVVEIVTMKGMHSAKEAGQRPVFNEIVDELKLGKFNGVFSVGTRSYRPKRRRSW